LLCNYRFHLCGKFTSSYNEMRHEIECGSYSCIECSDNTDLDSDGSSDDEESIDYIKSLQHHQQTLSRMLKQKEYQLSQDEI